MQSLPDNLHYVNKVRFQVFVKGADRGCQTPSNIDPQSSDQQMGENSRVRRKSFRNFGEKTSPFFITRVPHAARGHVLWIFKEVSSLSFGGEGGSFQTELTNPISNLRFFSKCFVSCLNIIFFRLRSVSSSGATRCLFQKLCQYPVVSVREGSSQWVLSERHHLDSCWASSSVCSTS